MDDDLNTADGLAAIFELVRDANTAVLDSNISKQAIQLYLDTFYELTDVLAILYEEKEETIPQEILDLVEQRKVARSQKNFALADKIRDEIMSKGYSVEETRQGTVVKKL